MGLLDLQFRVANPVFQSWLPASGDLPVSGCFVSGQKGCRRHQRLETVCSCGGSAAAEKGSVVGYSDLAFPDSLFYSRSITPPESLSCLAAFFEFLQPLLLGVAAGGEHSSIWTPSWLCGHPSPPWGSETSRVLPLAKMELLGGLPKFPAVPCQVKFLE